MDLLVVYDYITIGNQAVVLDKAKVHIILKMNNLLTRTAETIFNHQINIFQHQVKIQFLSSTISPASIRPACDTGICWHKNTLVTDTIISLQGRKGWIGPPNISGKVPNVCGAYLPSEGLLVFQAKARTQGGGAGGGHWYRFISSSHEWELNYY